MIEIRYSDGEVLVYKSIERWRECGLNLGDGFLYIEVDIQTINENFINLPIAFNNKMQRYYGETGMFVAYNLWSNY